MELTHGILSLVPTPIGNLKDVSVRVLEVLADADLIAAEDTRVSAKLLADLQLPFKDLISYHAHNEQERVKVLLTALAEGKHVALISDAGMPGISDPGEIIVKQAIANGFSVTVIPGPNAAITAVAASGLSTRYFHFEGFIPTSGKERKDRLSFLGTCTETMVIYEAPHRLEKTLNDFVEHGLAERKLCLARELTKRYETYLYLSIQEAHDYLLEEAPRGEYVLVMEGETEFFLRCPEQAERRDVGLHIQIEEDVRYLSSLELSPRSILGILQRYYPMNKNDLYRIINNTINLKKE